MNPFRSAPLILACLGLAVGADATAAARCTVHSGSERAVLLELYTSEGCDSCPPADRRLSQLKAQAGLAGRLVPLAFHVDYWDRLGWADRYASPRYTERQYAMASLARSRQVYTPQFLRNGRDWRSAGSPLDLPGEARPGATIVLELAAPNAGRLAIDGELTLAGTSVAADAWIAVYENNLESQVRAGENSGKTLRHDYVVRRLIGPLAPDQAGRVSLRQAISLDAGWKGTDLGVVVFAQDRTNGEILQAVQRPVCAG
jgi:hypothetical protein